MSSIASTRWSSELLPLVLLSAALAPGAGCAPSPAVGEGAPARTPPEALRRAEAAAPTGAAPAGAGSRGWTAFRGTPARTGRADVRGPRAARLAWAFPTRGRVGADAAVSADGSTVYAASHDGRLYALTADGALRWSFDTGGAIWAAPAIGPTGALIVGSDADAVFAVDPDGRALWRYGTAPPRAKGDRPEAGRYDADTAPAVLPDGRIVVACGPRLVALRPDGGGAEWELSPGRGGEKIFSSPALGRDGTLYFGTQGDRFYAVDGHARVLWAVEAGGDVDATPAVGDDGTVYFGSDDGWVRAVAPGGALAWRAPLGGPVRAPLAVGSDGTVFASTYGEEPFLAALDGATGREKWRFRTARGEGAFYGIQSGALVDSEGYVYFGGRDRCVYCLSPRGELVWRHETGDQVDAGPVLGPDGTLYVGSDDGKLYAFRR